MKFRSVADSLLNLHRRDPLFGPVLLVSGLILFSLQQAGGARHAEFDGSSDEAAQFVSGQIIGEYLRTIPHENPIAWAGQYYLHYPKVAIGHWPPGYQVAEGVWSLVFGSSRNSAMWLQWFLGLASIAGIYTLARPRFPIAVTAGILLLTMATPVFQAGLEQTMSELACLLCGVLFMHAMLLLLEHPNHRAVYLVAASLGAAAMVKGTAVYLLPVPAIALAVSRKKFSLRSYWPLWSVLMLAGVPLAWYLSTTQVVYWAGITRSMPWPVPNLGKLAGWGFLGVAGLGLRRNPLAILSASIIGSSVAVSFAVRALTDPRHWIMVLPAILMLTGFAISRFSGPVSAILLVPALLLFPWQWYRQQPAGYASLLAQLHLPSRMLVSSGRQSLGEGGWIAEVNIADRYPGSFIVRASKVLASSGWNGEDYQLQVHTPGEVLRRLDELALDVIIMDRPSVPDPPDHTLLQSALAKSPSWQVCADSGETTAYCRAKPPAYPRKPLVLDVGGWRFEERVTTDRPNQPENR